MSVRNIGLLAVSMSLGSCDCKCPRLSDIDAGWEDIEYPTPVWFDSAPRRSDLLPLKVSVTPIENGSISEEIRFP